MANVVAIPLGRRHAFLGCLCLTLVGFVCAPALGACNSARFEANSSPVDVVFDAAVDKIVGGVRLSDPTVQPHPRPQ